MNNPYIDEFEDDYLPDNGDNENGSVLNELDGDSLYLDEADRGLINWQQEIAENSHTKAHSFVPTTDSDKIATRKRAVQKRINAARTLAVHDARLQLKFLQSAASRELRTLSLPRQYQSRVLRYLMRQFVSCAASHATQNSAALMTRDNMIELCYKTILHCSFTTLAERGYCTYSQAAELADKLTVRLGLEKTYLSLENRIVRDETGRKEQNSEFGFEPGDDETEVQDMSIDHSNVPAHQSEPCEASTAQIRACSVSLRQAARHLLKAERQLNSITRP